MSAFFSHTPLPPTIIQTYYESAKINLFRYHKIILWSSIVCGRSHDKLWQKWKLVILVKRVKRVNLPSSSHFIFSFILFFHFTPRYYRFNPFYFIIKPIQKQTNKSSPLSFSSPCCSSVCSRLYFFRYACFYFHFIPFYFVW